MASPKKQKQPVTTLISRVLMQIYQIIYSLAESRPCRCFVIEKSILETKLC